RAHRAVFDRRSLDAGADEGAFVAPRPGTDRRILLRSRPGAALSREVRASGQPRHAGEQGPDGPAARPCGPPRQVRSLSMQRRLLLRAIPCILSWAIAHPAGAQVPPPISSGMFSLPGAYQQPPSAAAAGMDLANEWLGDSPYSNPAAPRGNALVVS